MSESTHAYLRAYVTAVKMKKSAQSKNRNELLHSIFTAAAEASMGSEVLRLAGAARSAGIYYVGRGFPTFDLMSANEICRVRAHWTSDDNPDAKTAMRRYRQAFDQMLWEKADQVVDGLIQLREIGTIAPTAIASGSIDEIKQYLVWFSVLRVPDDHVDSVRLDLVNRMHYAQNAWVWRKQADYYALVTNMTDEERMAVTAQRIQGCGITSFDAIRIMQEIAYF